ncbi:MAG: class I SAM-dependent methyltransferase [Candidatus Binatia bacterium]|nr:class I SAM-dependent methyltransferase [Candidatus Binatia bacterium]
MRSFESAQAHESKLYAELSYLYDFIFTRIFAPRIHRVIRSLEIPPGARVLEVGVGTGLSLDAYPEHAEVVGIDLAADMLDKAEDKLRRHGWRHIKLLQMDALNLKFEDDSFDFVTAFHVVSVVPDARKLMTEILRVLRPQGTLAIVNHFRSPNRFFAALDRLMEPVTLRLGWHTLDLRDVLVGLPLEVIELYKTSRRSLFTILVARNAKAPLVVGSRASESSVSWERTELAPAS